MFMEDNMILSYSDVFVKLLAMQNIVSLSIACISFMETSMLLHFKILLVLSNCTKYFWYTSLCTKILELL